PVRITSPALSTVTRSQRGNRNRVWCSMMIMVTPCALRWVRILARWSTSRGGANHLEGFARSTLHPGQVAPAGRQKRPDRRPLNNARLQVEQANHHVLDRRQFAHEFGRLKRSAHAKRGPLARRGVVDANPFDERGASKRLQPPGDHIGKRAFS